MFKKIGDSNPIIESYSNGQVKKCPRCGKKITTVYLDESNNEFICDECDIDEEQEQKDDE